MKVGSLFDLLSSAHGVLNLFDGVETIEQAVSRCERLKRGANPDALLDAVDALRSGVEDMMGDTLDMHRAPEDEGEEEEEEIGLGDPDLDALMGDEPAEEPAEQSPPSPQEPTETPSVPPQE